MVCRLCHVQGRVQGVFYRASTQNKANELNLTGYAKNLSSGDVEVLACGEVKELDELCQWLWEGPAYAKVSNVNCEVIETAIPTEFITR